MKRFCTQGIFAILLAISFPLTTNGTPIIFDDFNGDEGHFASSPSQSSTSVGELDSSSADRVTTDSPLEGAGHEKLVLNSDGLSVPLRIRFLSAQGIPTNNNISFTTGSGVDGWIGFYLKTTVTGMVTSINLDHGSGATSGMNGSTDLPIIADGEWHLYEWDLDEETQWGPVSGVGGNTFGGVTNGSHTIDSIYIQDPEGTPSPSGTYFLDFVAKSDSGSISNLLQDIPTNAPIVFDDFNLSEGHFSSAPNSTPNQNIAATSTADRVTADNPLEGAGHQKLVVNASSLGAMRFRHRSANGIPLNNTSFTTSAGTDGWIGVYIKTLDELQDTNWTVQIWIEGASNNGSNPKTIVADGAWHLYEWNLDEAGEGAVDGWGDVPGLIPSFPPLLPVVADGGHTIDSIIFRNAPGVSTTTFFMDFVARSASGSVANLIQPPCIENVLVGQPLVEGQTSVDVLNVDATATNISVFADGILITQRTNDIVAGLNTLPTSPLVRLSEIKATQSKDGCTSVLTNRGVFVGPVYPTSLTFITQPGKAFIGSVFGQQPVVRVRDELNGIASNFTGLVTIAISNNPSSGVLSGTTTVNAVGGVATFSNLSINNAGVGYTLIASADGLTSATSSSFSVINTNATHLRFFPQPSNAMAGVTFPHQIHVWADNDQNQYASNFNGIISIALSNNPSGGVLSGITSLTVTAGKANFSGLSINKAGSGYTLLATAPGLASAVSAPFNVGGGPNIIVEPVGTNDLLQGGNWTFTVVATGALSYQWYHGLSLLSGATGASLTLSNLQPADVTDGWFVRMTNNAGTSDSLTAMIALRPDTDAPDITITTPKINTGTHLSTINVTGVVKDTLPGNSGIITEVKIVHNGVTNETILTASATPGNWNFTSISPILLAPGTNTMSGWAVDLAGNIGEIASFVFFYDLTNTLTLNITGKGSVKFDKMVYESPVTSIANVFKVGRSYQLDAYVNQGTNFVFLNWITLPSDLGYATNEWVKKASLSFVMQQNMVINANFAPNPFTALAGTFNGLFFDPTNVTHETAGFIRVQLKDKANYSGYLFFDGFKRPFTGKFTLSGTSETTVTRTTTISQPPVHLSLSLSNELITGSVSGTNGLWTSQTFADKYIFSPTQLSTSNAGQYTFQIPSGLGAPNLSPGGVGYGTVTNNPLGIVQLGGCLSDGEKVAQKVALSRNGQWPCYVPLYKNTAKEYKGSVVGWITFTNADFGPASNNVLTWIKKEGSASLTRYGAGFSNAIEIVGSPYNAPAFNTISLPLTVGNLIVLQDGNLTLPVTNVVTSIQGIRVNLRVAEVAVYAGAIGIRSRNGLIFPMDRTTIRGVVLQNRTNAAGFFLGATQSGSMMWTKD